MSSNTTNVLAQGIEIIGSITFQNDMHIDGKIEGEIFSESGKVTIGELADIKGDIKAGEVHIYGHVDGNVNSGRCHLDDHAVVNGDITTAVLSMVEGARLSGRAQIG
ncbi:MAG: polymer-forming cytoskeletal protein [Akkermansia sp.]|nr:polymer-forming cytoskeletal protein [Akkermansia sp.]MBQ7023148.1 polymer-forming cytoskeletal protein [Akkermansia sp.]